MIRTSKRFRPAANDAACIQHLVFRTGAGFEYGVFGRKLTNLMIIMGSRASTRSASSTGWRSWWAKLAVEQDSFLARKPVNLHQAII